ncbi:MAG TPA: NEW3 domain-containing protein [Limnochordales bacterium]|nr:NEW3 domain-containing protein [Limnochordales bacterium]
MRVANAPAGCTFRSLPLNGCSRRCRPVVAVVLASLVMLAAAPGAWAAVTLSTEFPGIAVEPGETRSISLNLRNYDETGQTVELAVVEAPPEWDVRLVARGSQVHRAYVAPREGDRPGSAFLNVDVTVPADAEPGDYPVVLRAGTERLELSLRVTEGRGPGQVELTTQYPRLIGPSGAEFQFPITLANRTGEDQTFQLLAQAPPGWRVQITPRFEQRQVASIGVNAGATQQLEVRVTPSPLAEAGEYSIVVGALAPGFEASLTLTTEIIGTFDMGLTTPTGRLNADATAGRDSPFTVVVENRGSAALRNITLSSAAPPNWTVTFSPDRIEQLAPGETATVTVTLRPHERAVAGDYAVSISARSPETMASSTFRVAVRTPTVWGWVGVGLAVVVIAGLFGTFRVYGRR